MKAKNVERAAELLTMTTQTTLQILKKARKLIEKPERWTKGPEARDSNGEEVRARSRRATCWCSYGALVKAGDEGVDGAAYEALCPFTGGSPIVYNDNARRTHAQVLRAFDKAIAKLSKAGA